MKKIILLISILITTATGAFPADFPDIPDVAGSHEFPDIPVLPEIADFSDNTDIPVVSDILDISKGDILPNKEEQHLPSKNIKDDELSAKVAEINSMENNEQKIKEWAKYNSAENYVIIDKKDCSANVYDKEGKEISRFEIGIGTEIGDDFNDTSGLVGKSKNTTPAGEYTLLKNIFNKSAYGEFSLSLGKTPNRTQKAKKVVALHQVPKFREKDRLKKFYDGNLANNRMSHGCINFMQDDFKEFTKYIKAGLKIYVLPEEKDNSLILAKNSKNEFELAQTKYTKD